jgi:hypothetical protein
MRIEPVQCALTQRQSQQFVAFDDAETQLAGVTWTLDPPQGTIAPNGFYTAPLLTAAATEVTVTGIVGGQPQQSATAKVRLVPLEVILSPTKVNLHAGEVQRFTANVPGTAAGAAPGIQWNVSPTLGDIDANGRYNAPAPVVDDRDIEVIATSTIDPQKFARGTIHLVSAPLGAWPAFGLFVYLVAVFGLVAALIGLWPPPAPSPGIVDSARSARVAAERVLDKTREDEQKAIAVLRDVQGQLIVKPEDNDLKMKEAQAQATVNNAQADRTAADQAAENALHNEERVASPLVRAFGWDISRDADLLWLVLIAGALGSFVYIARSFVDFVGNKSIRGSWSVWYLLYPLIGSALALIFYLAIRGGFLTTSTASADVNTFGLVAISGMVGMFSKQATNKLSELFTTLFKTEKDSKDLKDPLNKTQAT